MIMSPQTHSASTIHFHKLILLEFQKIQFLNESSSTGKMFGNLLPNILLERFKHLQEKWFLIKFPFTKTITTTLSHSNLQTVLYFPWIKKTWAGNVCAHMHIHQCVTSGAIPNTTFIYYRNLKVEIQEGSQIPKCQNGRFSWQMVPPHTHTHFLHFSNASTLLCSSSTHWLTRDILCPYQKSRTVGIFSSDRLIFHF